MSELRTADDWVAELDRRMDADPNVELAPVTVGIMRTTQIVHEAMRAEYLRGIEDAAKELDRGADSLQSEIREAELTEGDLDQANHLRGRQSVLRRAALSLRAFARKQEPLP